MPCSTRLMLASAAFVLAFNLSAMADQKVPKFVKKGKDYSPIRMLLADEGWRPAGAARRKPGHCDTEIDVRCVVFPEAEACSGTGLSFCNMAWRHSDETILVITTQGESEPMIMGGEIE
jgi:hypothetical protein